MDRGWTIRQVADLLGVSRKVVYQLVYNGLLTGRRIGQKTGSIRILESDLKAYLDSAIIEPAAESAKKPAPLRYPSSVKFNYFPPS